MIKETEYSGCIYYGKKTIYYYIELLSRSAWAKKQTYFSKRNIRLQIEDKY